MNLIYLLRLLCKTESIVWKISIKKDKNLRYWGNMTVRCIESSMTVVIIKVIFLKNKCKRIKNSTTEIRIHDFTMKIWKCWACYRIKNHIIKFKNMIITRKIMNNTLKDFDNILHKLQNLRPNNLNLKYWT